MTRDDARLRTYLAALARGGVAEAEPMAIAAVERAIHEDGTATEDYLPALIDYAQLCLAAEEPERARSILRDACQLEIPREPARLEALALALDLLGQVALATGEPDEALTAALKAVDLTEEVWGEGDHRWAQASGVLACVRAAQGSLRDALLLCDAALRSLERASPEAAARILLLRAAVLVALRPGTDPLDGVSRWLDGDGLRTVAASALDWQAEPLVCATVLQAVHSALERQGLDVPLRARLLERMLQVRLQLGDRDGVESVLRALVRLHEEDGNERDACEALRRLAILQEKADPDGALRAHEAVVARAAHCSAEQEYRARQAFGVFLVERRQRKSAAGQLRAAVAAAERVGDPQMVAAARATLGVFLQHGQRLEEAREQLELALPALPPLSVDGLTALNHLSAIREGATETCCARMGATIDAQLAEYVAARMPRGLRPTSVKVAPESCSIDFDVNLTEEESAHVDRLLRDGLRTLRQQASKP